MNTDLITKIGNLLKLRKDTENRDFPCELEVPFYFKTSNEQKLIKTAYDATMLTLALASIYDCKCMDSKEILSVLLPKNLHVFIESIQKNIDIEQEGEISYQIVDEKGEISEEIFPYHILNSIIHVFFGDGFAYDFSVESDGLLRLMDFLELVIPKGLIDKEILELIDEDLKERALIDKDGIYVTDDEIVRKVGKNLTVIYNSLDKILETETGDSAMNYSELAELAYDQIRLDVNFEFIEAVSEYISNNANTLSGNEKGLFALIKKLVQDNK